MRDKIEDVIEAFSVLVDRVKALFGKHKELAHA